MAENTRKGWEDKGFFVQAPYVLIDMDMSASAFVGFIVFLRHFTRKDKMAVYHGYYRGLARVLHFSPGTTIKAVREWEAHSLVTKEDTPNGVLITSKTDELWEKNREYCKDFRSGKPAKTAKPLTREEWLRIMPYQEYLQTPEWKTRREQALLRAGHRCQVCNSNNTTLNTHHRTYIRRGNELPEDLIVLCQSCHQLFHDNGKLEVAQ